MVYTKVIRGMVVIVLAFFTYIVSFSVEIDKERSWGIIKIELIVCIIINLIKWIAFSSNLDEFKNLSLVISILIVLSFIHAWLCWKHYKRNWDKFEENLVYQKKKTCREERNSPKMFMGLILSSNAVLVPSLTILNISNILIKMKV